MLRCHSLGWRGYTGAPRIVIGRERGGSTPYEVPKAP